MTDGTGNRVGIVYRVTNLTDDTLCVQPTIRSRENVRRTTPLAVVRLAPRARNVELINFIMRNFGRRASVQIGVQVLSECPTAEDSSAPQP
jgi:hypothetical protein